ncbi:MAG: hypothetical protein DRN26_02870 [Thermoplasmata archaeon]|nr:MAG: hypothetical protein DRN26_02870 [Thermoplasmata archaeon]
MAFVYLSDVLENPKLSYEEKQAAIVNAMQVIERAWQVVLHDFEMNRDVKMLYSAAIGKNTAVRNVLSELDPKWRN